MKIYLVHDRDQYYLNIDSIWETEDQAYDRIKELYLTIGRGIELYNWSFENGRPRKGRGADWYVWEIELNTILND